MRSKLLHIISQLCKLFLPGSFFIKIKESYCYFTDWYARKSYSQDGDDLVIASFVENRSGPGFYVDIGAHHPMRFSNTYYFYKQGWRGINVDATPGSMTLFNRYRPRDVNIEQAVSSEKKSFKYYLFNEPALNGFESDRTKKHLDSKTYHLDRVINIESSSLKAIFDRFLPKGHTIDFLSVDVEGMDLSVLQSNDWGLYRPCYIIAELLDDKGKFNDQNEVTNYLQDNGYAICALGRMNGIFFDTLNSNLNH